MLVTCPPLASKILMNSFPETKLARMNGILQTFTGLGMLVGPILGSLLFKMGGFQLPFYVVGVLLLALAVMNYFTVPSDVGANRSTLGLRGTRGAQTTIRLDQTEAGALLQSEAQPSSAAEEVISEPVHDFTFWQVLAHFDIWTVAMCMTISLMCLTFKEPVLALKL